MGLRDKLFPLRVQLAAQHSQRDTGVPACVTLAQWALESDYGRASMGEANNPFGIKWPPKSGLGYVIRKTWEVIAGRTVTVDAKFAKFASIDAAFEFHGRMLARPDGYYAKARPLMKDWRAYIQAIAPTYATDPLYAKKLIKLVETYKLYELNLPATQAKPKA